jgi:hypothetical protein
MMGQLQWVHVLGESDFEAGTARESADDRAIFLDEDGTLIPDLSGIRG